MTADPPVRAFPLVDEYHGSRMALDLRSLAPRRVALAETPRRLRREQSYGYIRALWCMWLADGRLAASVPPGAGVATAAILREVASAEQLAEPSVAERLKPPVNAALAAAGLKPVDRVLADLCFACSPALLRRHHCGDCRRLVDDGVPAAEGLELPAHCFPDGIVYGVVVDGRAVSLAHAHRTGLLEDRLADLGVPGTAPAHRRRGYAKTCVSAVVEHVARAGGEARYACSPRNAASVATARSVGFVPYAHSLVLSTPAPDL